ncbi:AP-1 complex subunit mu-2-like [Lagopus leucura]|uniref:AP-1 complex subunit mu-2-like n=1 Tax=Lagopus leucura TaxID=30410 RepID=UPI001C673D3E|nr:AP-1 complex subunit mu-2-like [Lagopus leucura]
MALGLGRGWDEDGIEGGGWAGGFGAGKDGSRAGSWDGARKGRWRRSRAAALPKTAAAAALVQVSASGSVVRSEVVGSIRLKVFLSGMPELRLGLNDRVLFELTGRGTNKSVELEDVKFHQCVRLSRFDNDRTISFIPPDGDFELMSYRLSTAAKPLIWIESVIERFSHSRLEILVKAKGQFKKQSVATGVEIAVPVPSDADSPRFKASAGAARYVPERNVVIWAIKSFPGGKEHTLRAHLGLPSVEKEEDEGRPPIAVRFEIPYFTVSGIQITSCAPPEDPGSPAVGHNPTDPPRAPPGPPPSQGFPIKPTAVTALFPPFCSGFILGGGAMIPARCFESRIPPPSTPPKHRSQSASGGDGAQRVAALREAGSGSEAQRK